MVINIRRVLNLANKEIKKNEPPTFYKRNVGFIVKLNISPRNKVLDKMKISSSKIRTTLLCAESYDRLKVVTQLFIRWWNRPIGVVLQGRALMHHMVLRQGAKVLIVRGKAAPRAWSGMDKPAYVGRQVKMNPVGCLRCYLLCKGFRIEF